MRTTLSGKQRTMAIPLGVLCGVFGDKSLATKCFMAAATGHYEGTERNRYRNRPSVRLESQDNGQNYGQRDAYISESRALEQTYDLVGSITRKYANHVVGDCRVTWATGDNGIDKLYQSNWERWMNIADADGKWKFPKLTKIAVETTIRECDSFGQFIGDGDGNGMPVGSGRIRLIEPDRVRNSASMMDFDTDNIIGGIIHDAQMNRTHYRIWKRSKWGNTFDNPVDIQAFQVRHMMDTTRADARRGITAFKAVIDHMRDEKEIVLAEKLSVKRNSKLALLVKNILGTAQAPQANLFGGTDTTLSDAESSRVNVQEVNNATDAYMYPSEHIQAHESNRPANGWFKLMEWMIHHVAIGLHLPFGVVWTMAGLSGPAVRFDLGQANRTFSAFRVDVVEAQWIMPIVARVTARDMTRGVIPYHPNWFVYQPRRPSSITIDIGREGKLGLEEIDAGVYSPGDYVAEDGRDGFEVLEDKFKWLAHADMLAAKYNIDIKRAIAPKQTVATIDAAAEKAKAIAE